MRNACIRRIRELLDSLSREVEDAKASLDQDCIDVFWPGYGTFVDKSVRLQAEVARLQAMRWFGDPMRKEENRKEEDQWAGSK